MALVISLLAVSCLSVVVMTSANLKIHVKGRFFIHLYWIIPVICALILLLTNTVSWAELGEGLRFDAAMNPVKILILFISMSALSIYLDQTGVFRWLAARILRRASTSQIKLFVLLYVFISLLTIITSSSTIILTFTPFICYFAKNSGINPAPFLFMEFVAANTWNMFLIVGNATNIYVASSFGISFIDYMSVMAVPTVISAIVSFGLMLLLFRKELRAPLEHVELEIAIKNKPAMIVGVTGMTLCTVLLIISSYVAIEMWLICLVCATCVLIAGTICFIAKKNSLRRINKTLARMPWHLIPFLMSMFVLVLGLRNCGVTDAITDFFKKPNGVWTFGLLSAVVSNFTNNIPMSMFFTDVLTGLSGKELTMGIYATIIGSNLGALITPVASMSAIMWRSTIRHKHVNLSMKYFLSHGIIIAIPTLIAGLAGLLLVSLWL